MIDRGLFLFSAITDFQRYRYQIALRMQKSVFLQLPFGGFATES